jgi:hypothetical protein
MVLRNFNLSQTTARTRLSEAEERCLAISEGELLLAQRPGREARINAIRAQLNQLPTGSPNLWKFALFPLGILVGLALKLGKATESHASRHLRS